MIDGIAAFVPQLIDGTCYEGIFHTMKIDGRDTHIVLKYAKVARDPSVTAEDLQVSNLAVVWNNSAPYCRRYNCSSNICCASVVHLTSK